MIEIQLPIEHWKRGEAVGLERYRRSKMRKGKPRWSYEPGAMTGPETHVYGARGEAAFAFALGLDWKGPVDTFRVDPDVEPNWEVRTASNPYNFKVAPGDRPSLLVGFVLNDKGSPVYQIVGCIKADWAQRNLPLVDKPIKGKYHNVPAHWPREHTLTPINPGFHATHSWLRDEQGQWACAYCPERFEGAT